MDIIKTKSDFNIIIRQENSSDYSEVHELICKAFATENCYDVADYFEEVRKKDTFIPELSFVAVSKDEKIVGQIALYETDIITDEDRKTQLVLSPVCVLPEYFNRGIAREMIVFALDKAKEMGYAAVFLQGNPKFYEKFGFEPSYKYGIYHENDKDKNADYCMINILAANGLDGITGITYYE